MSSTVFREIAKPQPFRLMALLALRNSRLRLRYFTDYLNRLSLTLDDQKVEAYAPMAALIHDERNGVKPEPCPEPAKRIKEILAQGQSRDGKHVVIEAPGSPSGRALAWEVIRRVSNEFRNNPQTPLPVLCSDSGGEIADMVAQALGDWHIDQEFLKEMLEAGCFVIFIDDPNKMAVKADAINKFVGSKAGNFSRLVITLPPDKSLKNELMKSSSWIWFELTEKISS
jgi:hypothetical protein